MMVMKTRTHYPSICLALLLLLTLTTPAAAAEIKVLCAYGMQTVMEALGPSFERASGHKLSMAFATGGEAARRAAAGEAADVLIAPAAGVAAVVKDGKALAGSVAAIASTGISVAVRKGATPPDVSSPEAFKQALLAAKSITYLNPQDGGASGIHFAKVLERLGIADVMQPRTVFAPKADAVATLVASGQAEIGVLQFQLLMAGNGIDIVGPLPGDLQNATVFSAALLDGRADPEAARALLAFLRSAEAAATIKVKGMEPLLPARP